MQGGNIQTEAGRIFGQCDDTAFIWLQMQGNGYIFVSFLVGGDMLNGVMYLLLGAYLLRGTFSYVGYLAFSLVLASLRAFDELAYNSIFPMLLPEGAEQKGYAVASTLYPVLRVMMLPLSAVLLDAVGAAWLLVGQGVLSLMAAAVESGIRIHEERRPPEESSSLRAWWADVKEAARYLRQEKGLMNIYGYMAVTNGVGTWDWNIDQDLFVTDSEARCASSCAGSAMRSSR